MHIVELFIIHGQCGGGQDVGLLLTRVLPIVGLDVGAIGSIPLSALAGA